MGPNRNDPSLVAWKRLPAPAWLMALVVVVLAFWALTGVRYALAFLFAGPESTFYIGPYSAVNLGVGLLGIGLLVAMYAWLYALRRATIRHLVLVEDGVLLDDVLCPWESIRFRSSEVGAWAGVYVLELEFEGRWCVVAPGWGSWTKSGFTRMTALLDGKGVENLSGP